MIAISLLAVTPAQVSVLTALIWLPNLLGVFVGAWVDQRTHKRRLMIIADLIRAVVLLSLPVAYLFDAVTLTQLYLVALLTGAGAVLFAMARQAFFVALVPPSAYVDANSKLSMSRAASFVAGPAVGGGLVQAVTAPIAVVVDAVSFLGSALLLRGIPVTEVAPPPQRSSTLSLVREGLVLVVRHPVLRAALGCTSTVNFFTFIATALLVLYASQDLELSAGAIGIALGAGAFGGLAGAALAPRVSRAIGLGRTAMLGVVLFPAPLALTALVGGPTWAKVGGLAAIELVSSVGVMLMDVNLNALIIAVTPPTRWAAGPVPTAPSTTGSGRSVRWSAVPWAPPSGCGRRWSSPAWVARSPCSGCSRRRCAPSPPSTSRQPDHAAGAVAAPAAGRGAARCAGPLSRPPPAATGPARPAGTPSASGRWPW
ncbi:MFS transporter [Micromonospora vulcania]